MTHSPIERRRSWKLGGGPKNVEKRQEDRNARLATIAVRFADDGDVGAPSAEFRGTI